MLLSAKNLSFSYLEENIIHQLSFHIGEQEKIALIGKNGVGKTTLFKLLMGELNPNSGEIYRNSGIQIGYLAQNTKLESDAALFDELYSANPEIITLEKQLEELATQMANPDNTEQEQYDFIHQHDVLHEKFERMHGYRYRSDVQGILQGLGFSEERYNQKVSTLSGGQKTRIALAKLLLQKPDLLLLDEPTNHLDLQAITWLEGFLADYPGALLIISHDRYFLDKVVRRVFHLTFGKIEIYEGNYSFYLQEKTIRHEIAEKSYANQQKELARQQNIIATLKARNREKFIKRAESREKLLEKMTLVEKPMDENEAMSLSLSPKKESGNDVLRIDSLTKSFDSLTLFQNLNLYIRKGERIALIGENGSGKTTLLRILLGKIPADSGEFRYGSQVMVSYYDQEHANLDEDKTIFDEISDTFPEMTQTAIRNLLAAFLFTGEDVFQKISSLSGGERGRLSLAKMMLAEGNFLLLDEPTNHLDLTSREVLENALTHYSGTLLFISHDRYFINQIATKVIELHPDNLLEYPGNYDYYLEKRLEKPVEKAFRYSYSDSGKPISYLDLAPSNRMKTKENPDNKKDWLKEKEEKSKLKKQQNYRKTLEEKIEQAEQRISDLEYLLTQEDIYTDYEKAAQISAEKDTWEETLLSYYTEIDSLS